MATRVGVMVVIAAVVLLPVMLYVSYLKARYRAFKTGAKRVPVFGGAMELILWNPGETVVLLRNKVLEPANPDFRKGGITRISAWSGEEYKGFISSKTELLAWKSDQIHTSDGLPIQLHLNVWWHIAEPQKYVSRIATYYRDDAQPGRKPLSEAPGPDNPLHRAAAEWIMKLTAATVREQVNKLPAEKLISPHAQSFIPVADGTRAELGLTFRTQISDSASELRLKTAEYGLVVERLEVQELLLPPGFQDKLEELRQAFMEPTKAYQQAAANKVRGQAAADVRLYELGGLANIIGADGVRAKEVLKEVNFAGMSNPMIAMTPMFDPMREAIRQTAAAGLAADKKDSGDAGTNRQIEGGANAGPPADPPKSP